MARSLEFGQLERFIKKEVESAARNGLAAEGIKKLKENIDATVYSSPASGDYTRTHAMRDSATANYKIDNNSIQIEIFNDPSLMGYDYPSFISGGDHRYIITQWLNEGTSGSPFFNHPQHGFIEKTFEFLERSSKKILVKALRARGIDAS